MKPIIPMEPKKSDDIPQGPDWIAQVKWDGVRILAYLDADGARLFNRKGRARTHQYPEIAEIGRYCSADAVVLDGEVIALGQAGTPDFHEVMKRDAIRRMDRVGDVQARVPVVYMVFDVLFHNGVWLTQQPLEQRLDLLERIVTPDHSVQVVPSHDDGQALFDVMVTHGMEGVVVKRLDSRYYIGEKRDVWRKIKNYQDLVAVIGGFTLNDAGVVNALLLGLYDDAGQLWYIGHSGTGRFTHQDWRQLTARLTTTTIPNRPFVNVPERKTQAQWVTPRITVKIKYMEWTTGNSVRQPTIEGIVDVPPVACRLQSDMFNT